jgi:hypothetical protein
LGQQCKSVILPKAKVQKQMEHGLSIGRCKTHDGADSDSTRSTSAQEPRTFLRWSLFGLVLIVAFGIFLWSNTAYDIDDAPITYRYADNIVQGNGFVYNPGERVLGTSTPLYTLLLASLGFLGISSPTASNVLNLLGSLALVATTMALAWRLNRSMYRALCPIECAAYRVCSACYRAPWCRLRSGAKDSCST